VAHRKSLNEQQLEVLRWIADGCPAGVTEGFAHRISAAALRRRGLVTTAGRGPTWRARLTDAGRNYLERAAGPDAPVPRQANRSVTQQLVDDVIAAGGQLRVRQKHYPDRDGVNYYQRAALAERYGKVPVGKRLTVKPASATEVLIELVDIVEGELPPLGTVPVPERVARYHRAVKQYKAQADRHEVSRASLPRALRLIHALAAEAERRGYKIELAPAESERHGRRAQSGGKQGHIAITVDEYVAAIRISEEGLPSRAHWERQNRSWSYRGPGESSWTLPPLTEYEANATGRLQLEIVSGFGGYGRPAKWADRKSWTLDEKLPELLREVELRAVEQREREHKAAEEAAQREREWDAALQRARGRYAEDWRGKQLEAEVARWRRSEEIRAYCEAAESAHPANVSTADWVAWARRYADRLDPLSAPPEIPQAPESLRPAELRPYLEGWDPYAPTRRAW
jgi:hypothetical protein